MRIGLSPRQARGFVSAALIAIVLPFARSLLWAALAAIVRWAPLSVIAKMS